VAATKPPKAGTRKCSPPSRCCGGSHRKAGKRRLYAAGAGIESVGIEQGAITVESLAGSWLDPEVEARRTEAHELIADALKALAPRRRTVVELHDFVRKC